MPELGRQLMQHCQSKVRFEDRHRAETAMQELKSRGDLKKSHTVYRCMFCDGYHIGRHKRRK